MTKAHEKYDKYEDVRFETGGPDDINKMKKEMKTAS